MKSKLLIKKWKTISSKIVFDANPWFKIFKDTVKLPSNRIVNDYYRIEGQEYVLIYARSSEGKILVERQYKHGLGKITTTFPAGFVDKNEKPLNAAKRELLEETGFHAKIWKYLGTFILDGTRNYGKAHYFIAEEMVKVTDPQINDMEQLEILFLSIDEILSAITQDEISLLPAISIMAIATNPLFENMQNIVE